MTLGSKICSLAIAAFGVSSASAYVSYLNRDISQPAKEETPILEESKQVSGRKNLSEFVDWPSPNGCTNSCANPMEIAL